VFFSGLELVPPGVVLLSEWRPDETGPMPRPDELNMYGAVGRKPSGGHWASRTIAYTQ
jgi:hypothetical protein